MRSLLFKIANSPLSERSHVSYYAAEVTDLVNTAVHTAGVVSSEIVVLTDTTADRADCVDVTAQS